MRSRADTEQLTRVQTQVSDLEEKGLLPGAGAVLADGIGELERTSKIAAVTNNMNAPRSAAVFSGSDAVTVRVLESEYARLVDGQGALQTADAMFFETHERLNRDTLSRWQVALALSRTEVPHHQFVGILQAGADIMDPQSFDAIVETNRRDCEEVFSGHDIQYFTHEADLTSAFYAREETRARDTFEKTVVSLKKRTRVSLRHQETYLEALETQLQYRRNYDETFTVVGLRNDQVAWDQLLRSEMVTVIEQSIQKALKSLSDHFKTYNGGTVYKSLVDYLRENRINPRVSQKVQALELALQSLLAVKKQEVFQTVIQELVSDINEGFETALHRVLNCISEEYCLDEADIRIEGQAPAERMEAQRFSTDARRALISNWKRIRTCLMEIISGAVIGGIIGVSIGGQAVTGAVIGGFLKGLYGYYDIKETESSQFEVIVERQIEGVVRDAERDIRVAFSAYVKDFRGTVEASMDKTVAFIESELAEEIEAFEKMAAASADELRTEIERVQETVKKLRHLLETLGSIEDEEPAAEASESEDIAAD